MSSSLDSTKRFSTRVSDYVKYRPDYPREIVGLLVRKIGLSPGWTIADIGCGTGISCRMFLENGNRVIGVEPNDDMRRAALAEFAGQPRFEAIPGTAEATGLPDQSVDLVIAAQAFHWFDHPAFARECRRILRPDPGGWVAVMWNTRQSNTSEFSTQYDELLMRFGTDYKEVAHRTPMSVERFAGIFDVPSERLALPNHQVFDFDALRGRVRSSSYTPLPGQPGHDELYVGLRELFDRHQQGGQVRFDYETELFLADVCNRKSQF